MINDKVQGVFQNLAVAQVVKTLATST